ncbi:serine hydrolase-domain-containing protein [Podospora fimiseda]|uniref:Serine hydrolase-domain-containing protein n=1 Tax=Podospora fimiseda TaxID=252190 RepID=A0AAN7H0U9_9PEZI|nr:serine hydrolase-domain-containing protein [Podospora fimiseda]
MKFLCLPGAYGSAKNFKVQLGPLAEELESRGLATFTYSQGSHEVEPPAGWEDYFGSRPLYRFLDTRQGDTFETLRRLRHVPHSMNAEDTMRMFQSAGHGQDWHQRVWREALDGVFKTLDEDPEIDGIIGYSEGAMVGASLIVEEAMRAERSGSQRRIKFAIFISGAPPLKFEGKDRIKAQLFDEVGAVIDIPTFHIFGCDDAFLSSAVALFNVCDPATAHMYDHGLGHIVPRDAENVGLLGNILAELLPKVEESSRKATAASSELNRPQFTRTGSETDEEEQKLAQDQLMKEQEQAMLGEGCL